MTTRVYPKGKMEPCAVPAIKSNDLYQQQDYELIFTKLGVLKICDGKYGCLSPKHSPTLERSRKNHSRRDNYDEDELINAMEKFPDFLPPGFAVSIGRSGHVLGSERSQGSLADRNVFEWIRREYGMFEY